MPYILPYIVICVVVSDPKAAEPIIPLGLYVLILNFCHLAKKGEHTKLTHSLLMDRFEYISAVVLVLH